ncbi:MAG TPA: hypothetical protein EYP21_06600, partial [Syntrophaceae bacterium]|nr:hypothetical protein [Syntrophaceae bacterium]
MVYARKIHRVRLGRYVIGMVLVIMVLGYIFFRDGGEQESEIIKEDEPIKIALIRINQEGLTHYGDMFLRGVQLMLDQINGRHLDLADHEGTIQGFVHVFGDSFSCRIC